MKLSDKQVKALIKVYDLLQQRTIICNDVIKKIDSCSKSEYTAIGKSFFGFELELPMAPTRGEKIPNQKKFLPSLCLKKIN